MLQNRAGKFVIPTIESFQASAANADWENASGFYMVLTDQPGEKSWPITGASYILVHKQQKNPAKIKAMLKFFGWCYREGGADAVQLHYVPIPEKVFTRVESLWKRDMPQAAGSDGE
jgi:phosphate transport system substrate-binding protein